MELDRRQFVQFLSLLFFPDILLNALPNQQIELPPWPYGQNSEAKDTVLMFRGNSSHTFYGTGSVSDKPQLCWSYQMGSLSSMLRGKKVVWSGTGWTGQAVKLGDYVFVGSLDSYLYAFEARTGRVARRFKAGRMFKGSPCIFDNKIYIGNVDNFLRCVDPQTGAQAWALNTQHDLDSSPCVYEGRLYIGGENGYLRCLDPQNGRELWKTFLGGVGRGTLSGSNGVESSPACAYGEVFASNYNGTFYCLDAKNGKIKWQTELGDDVDVSPVIADERVYTATEEKDSTVYCLDRENRGRIIWRFKTISGFWSTPAVVGKRLYIGAQDGNLYCLDARSGKVIWQFQCQAAIWSSPAVVDGKVIFGSYDNHLYILDAQNGALIWKFDLVGRCISTPCVVDGRIYIGTATGKFHCFY